MTVPNGTKGGGGGGGVGLEDRDGNLAGVLKSLGRESVSAQVYSVVEFIAAKKVLKKQGFLVEEDETVEFKRTNQAKKVLMLVSEKGTTTPNLRQEPSL